MADTRYVKGQVARLKLNVKVGDVDTNPTAVTVSWKWEDGTTGSQAGLIPDDAGDFHHDLPLDRVGVLAYAFVGTGAAAGAGDNTLVVKDRRA